MSGNTSCSKKNDFEFLYLIEIMENVVEKENNGIMEWKWLNGAMIMSFIFANLQNNNLGTTGQFVSKCQHVKECVHMISNL